MRLIISLFLSINLFWTAAQAGGDVLIVLNKAEASAWLIDPTSGKTHKKLSVGEGPHEAAVSPDGRTAVARNYGSRWAGKTLTVIDIPSRSVTKTIDISPYSRPHGIQFFPDGKHVLITSETGQKLLKISIESGKIASVFDTGGGSHPPATARTGWPGRELWINL